MKQLIKKILKESINKKEYVTIFKLIDELLSNDSHFSKENLMSDDLLYHSGDVYEFLFDYLTNNVGYDFENANQIIGSYILTNQHNNNSGDDYKKDIIIASPKKYVGEFSQYISGHQTGHMSTDKNVYSKAEAMFQFRNMGPTGEWIIVNDDTESNDFEINDIWEDN